MREAALILRKGICYLAFAAVVAAGCGGGSGGGGTTPVESGTPFTSGELSGRAAVTNPPVSTSSQNVIGTAFSGNFSILKLRELNPSLTETRIVATTNLFGSGAGLVSFAIDGTDPVKITPTGAIDLFPSVSGNGKIVFERLFGGPVGAVKPLLITPSIWMIGTDGSGLTQMAGAGVLPSIDYAGDKFAFLTDSSHIGVMQVSNKAVTDIPLPTNTSIRGVALSPDGTTVYASLQNGADYFVQSLPANGGAGSYLLKDFGATGIDNIAIAPNGTELAVLAGIQIYRIGTGSGDTSSPVNLLFPATGLSYSADGKKLVVSMGSGPISDGLYTAFLDSSAWLRITSTTSTTDDPSWTPFIKDRTLIAAAGGMLGTHAGGVIQAQRAIGGTSSVVAFDVTTPSSVVITAQPTSRGAVADNLVFSVDADNIIKLAYANASQWRGIRAIGSSTPVLSANGCLVSIDGVTGEVISILPFTGTRAAGSRPVVTDAGTTRTFSGTFLAVYDKDGKNLASNGASTVKLDVTSGALSVTR